MADDDAAFPAAVVTPSHHAVTGRSSFSHCGHLLAATQHTTSCGGKLLKDFLFLCLWRGRFCAAYSSRWNSSTSRKEMLPWVEATSRTLLPHSITFSQPDVRPRCFLLSFFGFRRLRPRNPSFFAFMTPQKILRNCPHCGQKWLWWGVHDPTSFSCPDFGAPEIGPKPLKISGDAIFTRFRSVEVTQQLTGANAGLLRLAVPAFPVCGGARRRLRLWPVAAG